MDNIEYGPSLYWLPLHKLTLTYFTYSVVYYIMYILYIHVHFPNNLVYTVSNIETSILILPQIS